MALKRILLGTTALLTAGALSTVEAAEVKPLGALDINIGGFARWYAFVGDLKEKTQTKSGSYDFRTDTEVYVYVRGTDEATGLEYGANIELEADTNTTANADEMFVFIRGNFGEFRFGDDDGAADNGKIGAFTIAAFSGGIDGVGPLDMGAVVDGPDSGDDTKIIYYTPVFTGFQAGISFTPHAGDSGTSIGTTDSGGVDDLFEGLVSYRGNFGDVALLTAITGSYGHFNSDGPGTSDFYKGYGGAALTIFGFKLAGGFGYVQGGAPGVESGNAGTAQFERGSDYTWFNAGAAATFGPANVSVSYGQVIDASRDDEYTGGDSEPYEVVGGVDVAVAPGLVVGGEVAYFDNDITESESAFGEDSDGVLGLVGVRLAF